MKYDYKQLASIIIALPILFGIMFLLLSNQPKSQDRILVTTPPVVEGQNIATFAAGCFWCTEAAFQETPGVLNAVSGYAGGQEVDPTYEDVYKERTGHRESVQISYDPEVISYEELLDIFWHSIDPTDGGGQFVDRGHSYTTAIFYHTDDQRMAAEKSRSDLNLLPEFKDRIATEILPFTTFYKAEEYHQDFYQKSVSRYETYKNASGREEYKDRVWEEIQKN